MLQLVNNTEEGVYNGDIGKIEAIFTAKETESQSEEIIVSFEEIEITYKKSELDQLTLAYCCSIHKAQGSEYDLVILPLVDLYSRMLRRDIIYTAITRASKSLVLLGNPASFERAVMKMQEPRKTMMVDYLHILLEGKEVDKDESEADETTLEKKSVSESRADELQTGDESSDQEDPEGAQSVKLEEAENRVLTDKTIFMIDPMIGMDGLTPYDFMPENLEQESR